MSPTDRVGYKRPPRATRWKKGQSGNPSGRRRARSETLIETIDRLFLRKVAVVEKGVRKKVPTISAIVLRLWAKGIEGNTRALRTRLRYEELARENGFPRVEVTFVDSQYTRTLVPTSSSEDDVDG